jgi:YVTN family beta-propeller protein
VSNIGDGTVTPIDLTTGTPGTAIAVGAPQPDFFPPLEPNGVAITPNGRTAFVTNYVDGTVVPIDTRTDVAGAPIHVGGHPTGIAVMPGQAPHAAFTAIPAPHGRATSFDASGSGAVAASIKTYRWQFGDGSSTSTTVATIQHVYRAAGAYIATLTVTDTNDTSTAKVFTGHTMSRNGGPRARVSRSLSIG